LLELTKLKNLGLNNLPERLPHAGLSQNDDEPMTALTGSSDAGAIAIGGLVLLASVHVMFVGLILYGSKQRTAGVLATLTENGKFLYMPEREVPIYLAGSFLGILLAVLIGRAWRLHIAINGQNTKSRSLRACIVCAALGIASASGSIGWSLATESIGKRMHLSRSVIAIPMLAPTPVVLALLYVSLKVRSGSLHIFLRRLEREVSAIILRTRSANALRTNDTTSEGRVPSRTGRLLADIGAVVLISSLIFIPRTDLVAGSDFQIQSFHHWDYFAMAPAIGLVRGRHIATQVYSQYGIGWPLLLARLDPLIRLSYGHTYKIAVMYGCIYFTGLYWLLKKLLASPAYALGGVLVALNLQLFNTGRVDSIIWLYPQQSVLRSPCDIWVLLLVLAHSRSQRPVWLIAAGSMVGLSVLFIIDTGIYLALMFIAYCVLWTATSSRKATNDEANPLELSSPANPATLSARLRTSVASIAVACAVLILGLTAASGTSVFSPAYIRKWLEVLWLYPSGISMIPMAEDVQAMTLSFWCIILYLGCICTVWLRRCFGVRDSDGPVVGCIALLGFFYLIYYIGRSELYNIFHLSIPLSILCVFGLRNVLESLPIHSWKLRGSTTFNQVSCVFLTIASVMLWMNPQFRSYPSTLGSLFHPSPRLTTCYLSDVCVAANESPNIVPFRRVADEMKAIARRGKTTAVVANDDTSLYVASRTTPWNRYSPLLPPLITKAMLADVDLQLSKKPVDYVFLMRLDPTDHSTHPVSLHITTTDSWTKLASTIHLHYQFDHRCGPFDVWRR
jgi:hypothetical protein